MQNKIQKVCGQTLQLLQVLEHGQLRSWEDFENLYQGFAQRKNKERNWRVSVSEMENPHQSL